MLQVVAAVIESRARLLVCQRQRTGTFPLKWEFPGGKVAAGESPAAALERELGEELGVAAVIGPEIYRTRHRYAEMHDEIELIFFAAQIDAPAARNLAFEQMRWAERGELADLDFLPADEELVRKLAAGDLPLP
jgi:8-oxo-dGTP diphosphatase